MIFILILGILVFAGCTAPATDTENATNELTEADNTNETQENEDSPKETEITMETVAAHNTADDCWLVLSGKVYDVTEFIAGGIHPGGEAIIEGCGKDATTLFETRPMGSGTPHSDNARGFAENYYIGELEQ